MAGAGERDGGINRQVHAVREDVFMRPCRRSRNQHRYDGGEDESEPLAGLRRRCTYGAFAAAGIFLAAVVTDVVRHTPGDDMLVSAIEMAAVGLGVLCAFVATVAWVLTENTKYALAIWKASSSVQAWADDPWYGRSMADTVDLSLRTIPIDHGREIRRRRRDRHAV